MIQQAYNIFDSFLKIDEANRKYAGAHRLGEKPENRIGASTRAALSAAKLRAGESGLSDEERAMRQGQLANMETGLGFTTDYNQLYGAYDKAGIDPGSTGQNAAQGVGTANALAGMRYEGSGEQLAKETAAQSDRIFQNFTSIMDMGMGAGGQAGAPSGNFQETGPTVIDNNFGMSTPNDVPLVIDNNYGMSTPEDAPEYSGSTGYSPSGVFKDVGGATNIIDNNQPETGSYSWDNSGILGQPVMSDKMNIPSMPDNSGYSLVSPPSYPQAEGSYFKDYQKQPDIIPQMLSMQRSAERFPEIPPGYFNDIKPMSAPEQKYGSYESIFSPSSVIEPLGQRQPNVESNQQQDIVSMLLNLLNKNKPRA